MEILYVWPATLSLGLHQQVLNVCVRTERRQCVGIELCQGSHSLLDTHSAWVPAGTHCIRLTTTACARDCSGVTLRLTQGRDALSLNVPALPRSVADALNEHFNALVLHQLGATKTMGDPSAQSAIIATVYSNNISPLLSDVGYLVTKAPDAQLAFDDQQKLQATQSRFTTYQAWFNLHNLAASLHTARASIAAGQVAPGQQLLSPVFLASCGGAAARASRPTSAPILCGSGSVQGNGNGAPQLLQQQMQQQQRRQGPPPPPPPHPCQTSRPTTTMVPYLRRQRSM